ncbi:MAG TPA: PilZ domain-containing protein [Spirochaetia bacterium]|nr:PilZ domain-containing protein [Spirochaetia bacterium]
MVERRKNKRTACRLRTQVRRTTPDGKTELMEFVSTNLSLGGVFIQAEDLSLFDLGEELTVRIEDKENKFYEGAVRVIRSARVFTEEKRLTASGYGLMFIDPNPEFLAMLERQQKEKPHIIL